MTDNTQQHCDNLIVGGGIAALVTALELLKQGQSVTIVEGQGEGNLGGLARQAFGGMMLVGTPEQARSKIDDSPDVALSDWFNFADFPLPVVPTPDDPLYWPKTWAKFYVEHSVSDVYEYVKALGCRFLPAVNWVERGDFIPGNAVPRYHVLWGTSSELVKKVIQALTPFVKPQFKILYLHRATGLIENSDSGAIIGCRGLIDDSQPFQLYASNTIIATGGFTGSLDKVKKHWPNGQEWGPVPTRLFNGSHPSADGEMHTQVEKVGGNVTHMSNMWNYAAGINHPQAKFKHHGLSLIPCKSSLWLDHRGKRIGPFPLVAGFNTTTLCQHLSQLEKPYSWMVLNKRIALKEFAISGSDHNPSIRDKKVLALLRDLFFGNKWLYDKMVAESEDFIVADDIEQLSQKMNALTSTDDVEPVALAETLNQFDNTIKRGKAQWNDDQIRRIMHIRSWKTDKLRTCYPKPMLDKKYGPLVAIRVSVISRKSLGGIQTNLQSQVLNNENTPISGLYAVGEAAGFGGGGASGKRSLEGTFLSGCILTARQAAKSICNADK